MAKNRPKTHINSQIWWAEWKSPKKWNNILGSQWLISASTLLKVTQHLLVLLIFVSINLPSGHTCHMHFYIWTPPPQCTLSTMHGVNIILVVRCILNNANYVLVGLKFCDQNWKPLQCRCSRSCCSWQNTLKTRSTKENEQSRNKYPGGKRAMCACV